MSDRLERVRVVDPSSPYDGKTVDLTLGDGIIQHIEVRSEAPDACVSPGWVEVLASCGQPGLEERETFASLANAAVRGGYVQVAVSPEAVPVRDNATGIAAFLSDTSTLPIELLPLGTLSKGAQGQELSELFLQAEAGALGFFDAYRTTENALLLKLALEYTQDLDVPIYALPLDRSFNPFGLVHESANTTPLGLKTSPALAEVLRLERDLRLLEYAGGRLHVHGVSTAEGVALIAQAKERGLAVTADTTLAHLLFTDQDLSTFDTNLKVFPPLRSDLDRAALWSGLKNGTIDALSSGHRPHDVEHKHLEFNDAAWGAASLEFAYSAFTAQYGSDHAAQSQWVQSVSHGPRALLQLGTVRISEGMPAELTVFSPDAPVPAQVGKGSNYLPFKALKGGVVALHTRGTYFKV